MPPKTGEDLSVGAVKSMGPEVCVMRMEILRVELIFEERMRYLLVMVPSSEEEGGAGVFPPPAAAPFVIVVVVVVVVPPIVPPSGDPALSFPFQLTYSARLSPTSPNTILSPLPPLLYSCTTSISSRHSCNTPPFPTFNATGMLFE
ncbi:hypothetical protein TI39_contig4184g00004 [Zymoseptoria brevis]|uniref:Uncharacterized protein n=1 Tax=Zymoseptoria brevis TaxID=1047168 RepID=A0A0F4GEA1_9PEZI|nr:hypothetical protein TI39_contig4184g00004 [Zymoseptoria brevis]